MGRSWELEPVGFLCCNDKNTMPELWHPIFGSIYHLPLGNVIKFFEIVQEHLEDLSPTSVLVCCTQKTLHLLNEDSLRLENPSKSDHFKQK